MVLPGEATYAAPAPAVAGVDGASPAVVFDNVSFAFDEAVVLREVSFVVPKGSMTILLGPSGAGKSVILKLILGLFRPDAGRVFINGERVDAMSERDLMSVRADIGMLFQESALFDSLTVADNVGYRLYEETDMTEDQVRRRIKEVLGFIGLEEYIDRMPSELSGGQRRRVAIARAMAAKPSLLLLDDPTTGLDPITATTVDDEIVKLRDLEHVTAIAVTHQIRDAFYIASHEAVRTAGRVQILSADETTIQRATLLVLHDGRIQFQGSAAELRASRDAYLREFLFMTLPRGNGLATAKPLVRCEQSRTGGTQMVQAARPAGTSPEFLMAGAAGIFPSTNAITPPAIVPGTSSRSGSTRVPVRFPTLLIPYSMKSAVNQRRKLTMAPIFIPVLTLDVPGVLPITTGDRKSRSTIDCDTKRPASGRKTSGRGGRQKERRPFGVRRKSGGHAAISWRQSMVGRYAPCDRTCRDGPVWSFAMTTVKFV
jgi:phospholipid/cholesterol/gamma-HCH transport system ATP-binding protein